MIPQDVAKAVDAFYLAGFDRSQWQDGLNKFCSSIGAYAAITVPRVNAENTVNLPFSPHLEEFANQFVSEGWYLRDFRAENGWPLTDYGQRIVLEQDIATPEVHERNPIYQDLFLSHRLKWWAGITFKTPEHHYVLSVFRQTHEEPFSETDRALFDLVSDHLGRAVTIAERMATIHTEASLNAFEAAGEAVIVLDGRGWVVDMTGRAGALLGDGLYVVGRRLIASAPKAEKALRALLVGGQDGAPIHRDPVLIPRPARRPLLVDCIPVPDRLDGAFLFARHIVLLTDLDHRPVPVARQLMRIFRFSPSECGIAQDLSEGLTLSEAAERRSITRETVRSHLKSMFHKTGINRQSDLVALLHGLARRARPPS